MRNRIFGCKVTLAGRNAENIPDKEQTAPAAVASAGATEWTVVEERSGNQRFAAAVAYCAKEGRR